MTRFMHAIALGFLFHPLCLYASPVSYRIDTQNTTISLSWHAFGSVSKPAWER